MAVRTATAELTARERSEPRWSVLRVIPAFVWLWVVTRLLLLVISLNPRLYSSGVYGDVRAYGAKVERMFQGELPYRDVAIEYPPGSVPFTLGPAPHPRRLHAGDGGDRAAAGAALRPDPRRVRAAGRRACRGGPSGAVGGRARLWSRGQALPRRARSPAGARVGAGRGMAAVAAAHRAAVPGHLRGHPGPRADHLGLGHRRLAALPHPAGGPAREPARQSDRSCPSGVRGDRALGLRVRRV